MGNLWCINVGCADTSIIISDTGHCFMIDCYDGLTFKPYLPINKRIRALFITHQHYDHFTGIKYLIDNGYSVEFLVYSPYERRYGDNSVEYDEWLEFNRYVDYFRKMGTEIYKPYRQDNFNKPWWQTSGLKIWMIGPQESIATSDTRELHDGCLVFTVKTDAMRTCLFTGDASDKSLNWISKNTNNYCNDILHASHHGSIEGADLDFIKGSNAKYTVISTRTGVHHLVPHPTALRRYEDNTEEEVYRTDVSSTLKFNF